MRRGSRSTHDPSSTVEGRDVSNIHGLTKSWCSTLVCEGRWWEVGRESGGQVDNDGLQVRSSTSTDKHGSSPRDV